MPATPLRTRNAAGANVNIEPWSRVTPDRFGGYGSQYRKEPVTASPRVAASPRKAPTSSTPGRTERYVTPSERLATPSKPKEDSIFASITDRFTLPGSVYATSEAPGVGTYQPSDELQAARVRGAVKLQAAIRRRQSATFVANLVAANAESPARVPSAPPAPSAGFRAPAAPAGERFAGPMSIYGASSTTTPGVGEYDPTSHHEASKHKAHAGMASVTDRFDPELPGSVYAVSDAPGVGYYKPSDELQAARVRGAVKLQAAIRRRQSRGTEDRVAEHPRPVQSAHANAPPVKGIHAKSSAAVAPAHTMQTVLEEMEMVQAISEVVGVDALDNDQSYVPFELDQAHLNSLSPSPQTPGANAPRSLPRLSQVVSLDSLFADVDTDLEVRRSTRAAEELMRAQAAAALEAARAKAHADATKDDEEDAADGEWLFSQLERISPEDVDKADYYAKIGGWDLAGLRSDLAIYMQVTQPLDIASLQEAMQQVHVA